MLVGDRDGLHPRENRLELVAPLADPTNNFLFGLDGLGRGELTRWLAFGTLDYLKFTRSEAAI
jgi:hypothetical protein